MNYGQNSEVTFFNFQNSTDQIDHCIFRQNFSNSSPSKTTDWIGLTNIANESLSIGLPPSDIFLPNFYSGLCTKARQSLAIRKTRQTVWVFFKRRTSKSHNYPLNKDFDKILKPMSKLWYSAFHRVQKQGQQESNFEL